MRYEIITNPASGRMSIEQKRSVLSEAADILGARIHGLGTSTADELGQCAQELATHCDVLVVAGGDGTLSDVINAIDASQIPIGFLPLGTGNAMRHALGYKGGLRDMAKRIRSGQIHEYDLMSCGRKRRAFMTSIGFEGMSIRLLNEYRARGAGTFNAFLKALFNTYFKKYQRTNATIIADGESFEVRNLLNLMVVKQPYYGFGMKVVPKARFDDRQLHILFNNSGLLVSLLGAATAFTIGNRIGSYQTGRQLTVKLEKPLFMQIDGNDAWRADAFSFKVLPKALKIKC